MKRPAELRHTGMMEIVTTRLFTENAANQILLDLVERHEDRYHGKIRHLSCEGRLLRLFRDYEDLVNDNVLHSELLDPLDKEIDGFGFRVEDPADANRSHAVQLVMVMDADHVTFQLQESTGVELMP